MRRAIFTPSDLSRLRRDQDVESRQQLQRIEDDRLATLDVALAEAVDEPGGWEGEAFLPVQGVERREELGGRYGTGVSCSGRSSTVSG